MKKLLITISIGVNILLFTTVAILIFRYERKLQKAKGKGEQKIKCAALSQISAHINSLELKNVRQKGDYLRDFIYRNSLHKGGVEHDKYAWDTPVVIEMLWKHHLNGKHPPHLSCGPRAWAMSAILDKLGITNRKIHIFSDNFSNIRSHTFLEIFNPVTKQWEIQDPDYNISFEYQNGERPSTNMLVLGDLSVVIPISGKLKGWDFGKNRFLKENFFEAVMYEQERDRSCILINLNRFSTEKRFSENNNITFRKFAEMNYKTQNIVYINPFSLSQYRKLKNNNTQKP